VRSYGSPAYQSSNGELLAILRGEKLAPNPALAQVAKDRNPRGLTFFEAKTVSGTGSGLGPDGVFRDPWGNPYIITLDLNDDDKTLDGYYGDLRKNNGLEPEVRATVLIWSFGPDGKARNVPHDENKDNILSWE
jgi:hypothetical protein